MSEYRSRVRKLKPKPEEDKSDQDTIALDATLGSQDLNTRNSIAIQSEGGSLKGSASYNADGYSLTQKIEEFLEELSKIYSFKRKEVKIEIEFETDSDEEDD